MPEMHSQAHIRPQTLRSQAWRQELRRYPLLRDVQTRERDVGPTNLISDMAVLGYYAELNASLRDGWCQSLLTPFGEEDFASLQVQDVRTEFICQVRYPGALTVAGRVISVDSGGYQLAAAIFQDDRCTSLHQSAVSCFRNGRWTELPPSLLECIRRELPEDGL